MSQSSMIQSFMDSLAIVGMQVVNFDTTGGNETFTASAAAARSGKRIKFVKTDSSENTVTLSGFPGNPVIYAQNEYHIYQSINKSWELIEKGLGNVAHVGNFKIATTSVKSVGGSVQYLAMSTGISLHAGRWRLSSDVVADNNGSSPQYTAVGLSWYSANGADNNSRPTTLASASNLTINSSFNTFQTYQTGIDNGTTITLNTPEVVVTISSGSTIIYSVPFIVCGNATNGRVHVNMNAMRIGN